MISSFVPKIVTHVYGLLNPNVVLLPVDKQTKRCRMAGWTEVSYQQTQTPHYMQALAAGNIGVRLGGKEGICVIDVDDDSALESFLLAMPWLRETLCTRGAHHAFWVKVNGDCPSTGRLTNKEGKHIGEFRSSSAYSLIAGIHPGTKRPYETVQALPVKEITWSMVVWPLGVDFAESQGSMKIGSCKEDTTEFAELRTKVDAHRLGQGEEPIDWVGYNFGLATCPDIESHSTDNNARDFAVILGGPLGVGEKCCHQSCAKKVGLHAVKLRKAVMGNIEDELEDALLASAPKLGLANGVHKTEVVRVADTPVVETVATEAVGDDVDSQLQKRAAEKAASLFQKRMDALKEIHFDGHSFWYKIKGVWTACSADNIGTKLNAMGFESKVAKGKTISSASAAKLHIMENNRVDGALPLVHQTDPVWQDGNLYLNTSKVVCMTPAEGPHTVWGDRFEWLASYFDNLAAEQIQLDVMNFWVQRAMEDALNKKPRQSQALILVGGVHAGKTLLLTGILPRLLGGKADAASYMLQNHGRFTAGLFKSPLWIIDDSTPAADFRNKATFTAMMKKTSASATFVYEEKYLASITTEWMGRLVVAMNDDPLSLENLPSIESSNGDKLILIRCSNKAFEFPVSREEIIKIYERELPHYLAWLLQWKPPEHLLAKSRYGIISFHDQWVRNSANNSSHTAYFGEALEEAMDGWFSETANKKAEAWEGRITDLVRLAEGSSGDGEHAVLFKDFRPVQYGRMMKQLVMGGTPVYKLEYLGDNQRKPWRIRKKTKDELGA